MHYTIAGSYISQVRDIPSYLILFRDLHKTFEPQDVLDMVRLAAYHDFMAFLAVSYRNSLTSGLSLVDARITSVNTLGRFLQSAQHALHHNIVKIMIVIAKTVMPAPDPPVSQQQQRRLSIAVMSAPPAGYMPQSSSEEDEDGEESTAHKEPDYTEEHYSTHSTPIAHRAPTRAEVANIRVAIQESEPYRPFTHESGIPERSPPVVKARSPAVPARSPAVSARSPAVRLPLMSLAKWSSKSDNTSRCSSSSQSDSLCTPPCYPRHSPSSPSRSSCCPRHSPCSHCYHRATY